MSILNSRIEDLEPVFRSLVEVFLERLRDANIPFIVIETVRDARVQNAYYLQGRKTLDEVNQARQNIGLWKITEEENKNKITWTRQSKHLNGTAIDLVPMLNGKAWWAAPKTEYKKIADIAVECGLDAGFFWDIPDPPHYQMKG